MTETRRSVPWTRQTRAFTRRHVQQLRRNKLLVVLAVGWPVLWYFLTMAFFIEDVPAGDLQYVKAANGISYGLFGAFTVTVAVFAGEFARDLESDRYRKLRAMPVSPTADLTGRFVAGMALGAISYLVTILAAVAHGGRFDLLAMDATAVAALVAVLVATFVLFCVIAMALAMLLALVITKPEHMTTIAVVVVLMAFYLTGFNGVTPGMIADDPTFINYVPNSLATRMQLAAWAGADDVAFMTPPAVPLSFEYGGLLVGYTVGLAAVAVGIMRRFAYGGDP
ncbi:ABC transporter permease [Natronolimnohabitans innermongolicus]|uniref:ABC-type transport system permease protein n=1 Tax=Natronolimnohabitans innermongolicus JCM 12255 TaxID=1227499 RepID=L9XKG3_9EURY|nr:ABC transporter permease [Natronolimnohabitans innermongolicus]ELY61911.1 ABC-type transport system permease protein [Natronolimnohabitans innermongolicus JCM 12255]